MKTDNNENYSQDDGWFTYMHNVFEDLFGSYTQYFVRLISAINNKERVPLSERSITSRLLCLINICFIIMSIIKGQLDITCFALYHFLLSYYFDITLLYFIIFHGIQMAIYHLTLFNSNLEYSFKSFMPHSYFPEELITRLFTFALPSFKEIIKTKQILNNPEISFSIILGLLVLIYRTYKTYICDYIRVYDNSK
jgi:hypothetical protein